VRGHFPPEEESVSRTPIVITGIGCISPLGNDVDTSWRAAVSGQSGVAPIQAFDASGHETQFAAEVKGFDPDALLGRRLARRMDRFTQFAVAATQQAPRTPAETRTQPHRAGALVGTGIGWIGTLLAKVERARQVACAGSRRS
jgi:3-oxoacyl-[acyl-carrier-protein] synthase II